MREKWDRSQSGSTYGKLTIERAISQCSEIYTPRKKLEIISEKPNCNISSKESELFTPIVPLTPECTELPTFPVKSLPEIVADYVSAVAENSQTSPDMAAVIGLGILAVCLQGKYNIDGMPGYCEPLSLYTVVVASPGERKSGVMSAMTKYLYEYEQSFNEKHYKEVRENQQKRESIERQISGLKKKLENKNNKEKEEKLQQLENALENMPELKPVRYFADDCSSEALTTLLANNGGTLSVISAEGGIFDIMAGR